MQNHYLSQEYLQKFRGNQSPLFAFDKLEGRWIETTPKAAGVLPNLYAWTNPDGTVDDRVEKVFWRTENGLKAFYKELHRGNLTQNIASNFIMFISSMAIRVPDFIEKTRFNLWAFPRRS